MFVERLQPKLRTALAMAALTVAWGGSAAAYVGPSFVQIAGTDGGWKGDQYKNWFKVDGNWIIPRSGVLPSAAVYVNISAFLRCSWSNVVESPVASVLTTDPFDDVDLTTWSVPFPRRVGNHQ